MGKKKMLQNTAQTSCAHLVECCGVIWINPQSLLEITSEQLWEAGIPPWLFYVFSMLYNENTEESALSPSACPFPWCHQEPGLTEMEGLLFDSALWGLLIVSKWSPPATALIICDPACMLEERRGGRDQQAPYVPRVCVGAVKRNREKEDRHAPLRE